MMEIIPRAKSGLRALNAASSRYSGKRKATVRLLVCVDKGADAGFVRHARRVLFPVSDKVDVEVAQYGDGPVTLNVHDKAARPSLAIVIAARSSCTGELLAALRQAETPLALFATVPAALARQLDEDSVAQSLSDVIPVPELEAGGADAEDVYAACFEELAVWVAAQSADLRAPLAQAYPFMRRAVANECTRQAALANALVSAAFILPGSDLAPLTFNQIRLVVQIAALFDLPLKTARLPEAFAVVLGGLGCRALVRLVTSRVPVVTVPLSVVVAFGATTAIGALALRYYEQRTDDAPDEAGCSIVPHGGAA
ncbi:MAG: hypothetical protein LBD25_00725 [Coriobacteriales bacterium]|nr:hypothetical protein [Coriobacteriales bacterium]